MIHLHEERGLIQSIRNGETGHRYFDETAVTRLMKIKQLQAIGLNLAEITDVLPLYMEADDNGISGKQSTLAILREHLAKTDTQLAELQQLRDDILQSITKLEVILSQLLDAQKP